MQQTAFPFVCVIVDDASTDGEQEVIKAYLAQHFNLEDQGIVINEETDDYVLTFAQHKENRNCYFAVYLLKYNHYSIEKTKFPYFSEFYDNVKYHALCEGDDYWIDAHKLQKQIVILEQNPHVMLVHTGFDTVDKHGQNIERKKYRYFQEFSRNGDVLSRLLWRNYIMTLTVCVRTEVEQSNVFSNAPASLDYLYFLTASSLGDCAYLSDITSHYRILDTGAVATQGAMIRSSMHKLCDYLVELYIQGETKIIKGKWKKVVLLCMLLYQSFRTKALLFKLLCKKPVVLLVLPLGIIIKCVDYFGIRYSSHYNPYRFFNFIYGS